MDAALELYTRACESFDRLIKAIGEEDWHAPTPCPDWDVRELVNHVTVEDLWAAELFAGRTIQEVGTALDGDQLGQDPAARWDQARAGALAVAGRPDAMSATVHLSFGDFPGSEYALQLFADHLIHGWDLATAIGADTAMDPDLVRACAAWFATVEDGYRAAGAVGPRPAISPDADPQTVLLAAFGRTP
jgi:uncharacterized protein (TIGR03086 family)